MTWLVYQPRCWGVIFGLVLGVYSHSKTHSIAIEVYRAARERIGLFHLGIVEERAAHLSAYWISRRRILAAIV